MLKKIILYSLFIISFLSFVIYDSVSQAADGLLHIYILDIDQGDSSLIQTPEGKHILIDAGPNSYILQEHLQEILPWYKDSLEFLIITHPHEDHYAGFFDLENRYHPEFILLPNAKNSGSFRDFVETIKEHSVLSFGNYENDFQLGKNLFLDTLYPLSKKYSQYKNLNNSSIVQKLSFHNFSMLFTGDIEREGIELLNSFYGKELQSSILKASHHGSNNGWDKEFLVNTSPLYTTISSGRDNKYNHPHEETLEALQTSNSEILSTQELGNIEIITDGFFLQICWLEKKRRTCQEKVPLPARKNNEGMI